MLRMRSTRGVRFSDPVADLLRQRELRLQVRVGRLSETAVLRRISKSCVLVTPPAVTRT